MFKFQFQYVLPGLVTLAAATSKSVIAHFDNLPSAPFFAAPQLGFYGDGKGIGHATNPPGLPTVPSPYGYLNWTNFFVMNNSTATANMGYQKATPILTPCSGTNIAMGYRRTKKNAKEGDPPGSIHSFGLNFTGNTAKSVDLQSFCAACFIDIDGANKGHFAYYYKDEKAAVDCLLKVTANRGAGLKPVSALFNYTIGCKADIKGCKEIYRPMQGFPVNSDLGGAYEYEIGVEEIYYDGTVEGYHFSGRKEVMLALDNVAYNLNY